MKNRLFYALKIAISAGLIWLLFGKVDIRLFAKAIQEVKWGWILLAIAAMTVGWLLNTLRWDSLLAIFKIKTRFFALFLYNLISMFYTMVLPGGKIMGDLVRGHRVAHDHRGERQEKNQLFLLSFVDRGIGVLAFVIVMSILFIIQHPAVDLLGKSSLAIGIFTLVTAILGVGFTFFGVFDWLLLFVQKIPLTPLKKLAAFILSSLQICRGNKRQLSKALIIAFAVVLLSGLALYAISKSLGLGIDYWTMVFFSSLTVILILVPITIGGIGLREGGLTFLLIQYGIDPEKALALSFLNLFFDIFLFASLGGLAEFYYHFLGGKKYLQQNDSTVHSTL